MLQNFAAHYAECMRRWVLFSLLLTPLLAAQPLKVRIRAPSAILINAQTGAILFEKQAHQPCFPASTTKIATALFALHKRAQALELLLYASPEALHAVSPRVRRQEHPPYRLEKGGSSIGLKPKEALSLRSLLYGLLLASGNDAANVIAEGVSGSVALFVQEMNGYLRSIGCHVTTFQNPHGLHHPEHRTTAFDLALMTREAMRLTLFRQIVGASSYLKPKSNLQSEMTFSQHNALLKRGPHFYQKAIGVKTGYTSEAGYNLVAAAKDGERELIAVLLNCKESEHRFQGAISLFEAAFREAKATRTLFSKAFDTFTHPLKGAKRPLKAVLPEDVTYSYFPSEEPVLSGTVQWRDVVLPVRKGDIVGELQVASSQGQSLVSSSLYAAEDVEASLGHQILTRLSPATRLLAARFPLVLSVAGFALLLFGCSRKVR